MDENRKHITRRFTYVLTTTQFSIPENAFFSIQFDIQYKEIQSIIII